TAQSPADRDGLLNNGALPNGSIESSGSVFFDLDDSSNEESTEAEEEIGPLRSAGSQLSSQSSIERSGSAEDL
ncbi:unnamed protein product, partial [Candidula unifasciata]